MTDLLEQLYWEFDSLRKTAGMPMAERDAFKAVTRRLLPERLDDCVRSYEQAANDLQAARNTERSCQRKFEQCKKHLLAFTKGNSDD